MQNKNDKRLANRSKRRALVPAFLVALCAATTGCASSPSQAEIKFLETREIQRPYDITYDGALNAIFSMGMTIEHSDKRSGVISGKAGDYAHRASLTQKQRRDYTIKKVTLLLRPRHENTTQIRMKVLIDEQQQLDRQLMTMIWQRIEREVLLDDVAESRPTPRRKRTLARRAANPSP